MEEQKLNHRLSVADHLDELAERTGTPELHETAALHRQKALEHYQERLAAINRNESNHVPHEELVDGREELLYNAEPLDEPLKEVPSRRASVPTPAVPKGGATNPVDSVPRLGGQDSGATPQLRDEERKLAQRMEAAERLWETYEQTGNEAFAEAARALEDRALANFDQRAKSVRGVQRRRGVSDHAGQVPQEIEKPAPAGEVSVLVKSLP